MFFFLVGEILTTTLSVVFCGFLSELYMNIECTMNKCSLPEIGPVPVRKLSGCVPVLSYFRVYFVVFEP
jgi:hypothetical protein